MKKIWIVAAVLGIGYLVLGRKKPAEASVPTGPGPEIESTLNASNINAIYPTTISGGFLASIMFNYTGTADVEIGLIFPELYEHVSYRMVLPQADSLSGIGVDINVPASIFEGLPSGSQVTVYAFVKDPGTIYQVDSVAYVSKWCDTITIA